MKKHLALLLLVLSTPLFAQEPAVVGIENIYVLEGAIDDKYPITMYLIIENGTKKVTGRYYYNTVGDFIYLGGSILENTSKIVLKEFSTARDARWNGDSTGEFCGSLSDDLVFNGTWSNERNSFNFEVKPNPNAIVQEIEITEYAFEENFDTDTIHHYFEFYSEIYQISNPTGSASINKINEDLATPYTHLGQDFDALYSHWSEIVEAERRENLQEQFRIKESYHSSKDFIYRDTSIVSLVYSDWYYAGGNHGYGWSVPIIYSLASGKILNEKVADLISNVEDDKLLSLMREKLNAANGGYFDFENIRLNDNYSVDASGITFLYNAYEIAPYSSGVIEIHFTFEELKPFVKRDSELWYLFE